MSADKVALLVERALLVAQRDEARRWARAWKAMATIHRRHSAFRMRLLERVQSERICVRCGLRKDPPHDTNTPEF